MHDRTYRHIGTPSKFVVASAVRRRSVTCGGVVAGHVGLERDAVVRKYAPQDGERFRLLPVARLLQQEADRGDEGSFDTRRRSRGDGGRLQGAEVRGVCGPRYRTRVTAVELPDDLQGPQCV